MKLGKIKETFRIRVGKLVVGVGSDVFVVQTDSYFEKTKIFLDFGKKFNVFILAKAQDQKIEAFFRIFGFEFSIEDNFSIKNSYQKVLDFNVVKRLLRREQTKEGKKVSCVFYSQNGRLNERGHYIYNSHDFLHLYDSFYFHNEEGPAHIVFYENGNTKFETYYVNGYKHRTDGPAEILYYESGNKWQEKYYVYGQEHREDGPAVIQYYPDGRIKCEQYYIYGYLGRKDDDVGPAVIYYDESGRVKREEYYKKGELHRTDGPAIIEYYENGNIKLEEYYINGTLHRNDGPAIVEYLPNKSIKRKQFNLNQI